MDMQIILLLILGVVLSSISTFMLIKLINKLEPQKEKNSVWMKIYPILVIILQITVVLIKRYLYMDENIFDYIRDMTMVSLLCTATATDAKYMKIPNSIVVSGLVAGLIITVFEVFFLHEEWLSNLMGEGIAIIVMSLIMGLCLVVMKNSIGMGDVKILIVMALLLGLPDILPAVFVSLFVSFIVSIGLLLTKNKTRSDNIPFAPFMLAGTVIAIIVNGI